MPPPSRKQEVFDTLPRVDEAPRQGKIGTVEYLIDQTGMCRAAVCRHLRSLRDEGRAHIARWNRTTGLPAPVWVAGQGNDVPMPAPVGCAKYCQRHRKNVATAIQKARIGRKYDERYSGHVALALAADVAAKTRTNPQHWFSALGL